MIIYNLPKTSDIFFTDAPQTYTSYSDYYNKARDKVTVPIWAFKKCNTSLVVGGYTDSKYNVVVNGAPWNLTTDCCIFTNTYLANFGACQLTVNIENVFSDLIATTRFNPFAMMQYKSTAVFGVFLCYCHSASAGYIGGMICGNVTKVCPLGGTSYMCIEKVGSCCTIKVNGTLVSNNGYFCYINYTTDYTNGFGILYPCLICKSYGSVKYYKDI